jgi:poly(3-hydroxybutyrate) depolymerase
LRALVAGIGLLLTAFAGLLACTPFAVADQTLTVDGLHVLLHTPASGQRLPLVIALHGLGSSGAELASDSQLRQLADRAHFVVAFPDGHPAPQMPKPVKEPGLATRSQTGESVPPSGSLFDEARLAPGPLTWRSPDSSKGAPPPVARAWNAGICCGGATADDVTYLRHVVTAVSQSAIIDLHRVYVVGFSNGGMMALRAICDAPTVFAAAGSVDGPYLGDTCARPVWEHLHDAADPIVPYHGGISPGSVYLHVAKDWCGCEFPDSATEASRFASANITVSVSRTGGHSWPRLHDGSWNLDADQVLWSFLSRYRL